MKEKVRKEKDVNKILSNLSPNTQKTIKVSNESSGNLFPVCLIQLAAVAALCVQYEAEFRPNMSIVVKALQPLLKAPAPAPAPAPES